MKKLLFSLLAIGFTASMIAQRPQGAPPAGSAPIATPNAAPTPQDAKAAGFNIPFNPDASS
ncbi:MAG: hypothetical protein RL596_700, partial [Bacteroidota bacterium]